MTAVMLLPTLLLLLAYGSTAHSPQCATMTGIVFSDINRNNHQDEGEPGLAGIRVAQMNGWAVVTDEHGRYRVPCADYPDPYTGSSIAVEVDVKTLPTPYEITTENPSRVLLQAGNVTWVDFPAAPDVVRLKLWDESFRRGSERLTFASKSDLDKVVAALREGRLEVQLVYVGSEENVNLIQDRLTYIEELLMKKWHSEGCEHQVLIRSWRAEEVRIRPNV